MFLSVCLVLAAFVGTYGRIDPESTSLISPGKDLRQEKTVERIAEFAEDENTTIKKQDLLDVASTILRESRQHNIDYRLVLAIIKVESNFRHDAVSSKGARGLFQIRPSLAKYIADNHGIEWRGEQTLDEPRKNIRIGVHFFSELMDDYKNVSMALHAYNIGPTRLKEILSEDNKPNKAFSAQVLREYGKNLVLLPDP